MIRPVNYKNFLLVSKENDKEGLTVLMGYSANGELAPPMIVYANKQGIPRDVVEVVQSVDPSWALGKSESGWMASLMLQPLDVSVFKALKSHCQAHMESFPST